MCMTACEFIKLFPYHLNGMIEHRILSMWLWNRPSNVISTGSFQLRFLNYKVYFAYRDLSHRPFNVWYKKMQNNRHCERHVKLLSAACWFSRRSYWVIDFVAAEDEIENFTKYISSCCCTIYLIDIFLFYFQLMSSLILGNWLVATEDEIENFTKHISLSHPTCLPRVIIWLLTGGCWGWKRKFYKTYFM